MNQPKFKGNQWDLFYELVRTDFVMRYHNSILGFVWVLLKPFLLFLIIVTVFSFLFKSQDPYYHLNLLLGLLLYSYFSEGTLRGVTSLYDKSQVILKVNFPKIIAIYTSVVNSFISFLAGLAVFLVFWYEVRPPASLLGLGYLSLQVLSLSLLILALNLFTGVIYTKLRDLYSIWEVFLQLIFWGTPIVYPVSILPDNLSRFFALNPLAVIVTQSQAALITGRAYDFQATGLSLALILILLITGITFFKAQVKKVAENF